MAARHPFAPAASPVYPDASITTLHPKENTMRRNLTLLVTLAALLLTLPAAHADETTKRAKVEQLMTLTKVDAMLDQLMDQVTTSMKSASEQQMAKMNPTPEQQIAFTKFNTKVNAIIKDELSMDKLRPVMIKVYMDTYTEEELDGIVAFYRSPAGVAFVAKQPQLMQRSMQLMQQQMITLQPLLEQASKEFSDEITKTTKQP